MTVRVVEDRSSGFCEKVGLPFTSPLLSSFLSTHSDVPTFRRSNPPRIPFPLSHLIIILDKLLVSDILVLRIRRGSGWRALRPFPHNHDPPPPTSTTPPGPSPARSFLLPRGTSHESATFRRYSLTVDCQLSTVDYFGPPLFSITSNNQIL